MFIWFGRIRRLETRLQQLERDCEGLRQDVDELPRKVCHELEARRLDELRGASK